MCRWTDIRTVTRQDTGEGVHHGVRTLSFCTWRVQYEINAGYPMPRATVMGGVGINF